MRDAKPAGEGWDILVHQPLTYARPFRRKEPWAAGYLEEIAVHLSIERPDLERVAETAHEYFNFEHLRDENGFAVLGRRA